MTSARLDLCYQRCQFVGWLPKPADAWTSVRYHPEEGYAGRKEKASPSLLVAGSFNSACGQTGSASFALQKSWFLRNSSLSCTGDKEHTLGGALPAAEPGSLRLLWWKRNHHLVQVRLTQTSESAFGGAENHLSPTMKSAHDEVLLPRRTVHPGQGRHRAWRSVTTQSC